MWSHSYTAVILQAEWTFETFFYATFTETQTAFAKLMNDLVNVDQLMMFVWSKLKRTLNKNSVEILRHCISVALCKYLNMNTLYCTFKCSYTI